jgi:hypothetical protein
MDAARMNDRPLHLFERLVASAVVDAVTRHPEHLHRRGVLSNSKAQPMPKCIRLALLVLM